MMRRILVAAALLPLLAGCPRSTPAGDGRMPPPLDTTYADGPDGLRKLWGDILGAARKDDRERVHTLVMSDEDLDALFGVERARWLRPRYLPMLSTLINIGSMELVARVLERNYDDVEVFAITDGGTPEDRATLRALPPGTPVYAVRVKKKGEAKGLRYDFFVYRGGRWVTGNQIAKYLVDRPPLDASTGR
jgi:hypothetical protein